VSDKRIGCKSRGTSITVGRSWLRPASAEFGPGELLFFKRGTVHAQPKILEDPVVFLSIDTPRRDPKDTVPPSGKTLFVGSYAHSFSRAFEPIFPISSRPPSVTYVLNLLCYRCSEPAPINIRFCPPGALSTGQSVFNATLPINSPSDRKCFTHSAIGSATYEMNSKSCHGEDAFQLAEYQCPSGNACGPRTW
jgi:hypothetical protein